MNRRKFLAMGAAGPLALRSAEAWAFGGASAGARASAGSGRIPVGLEMYSVRGELKKDAKAAVRAVAGMGYECMEFHSVYFDWSESETKEMRKLLDDLGVRCSSTHNNSEFFGADKITRMRDMNLILGSRYAVMASSHETPGLDGWKKVAEMLNAGAEKVEPSGLKVGYHNHQAEFRRVEGTRPMEILAKNTKPSVMLQLDLGTCVEAGSDPVEWIRANPGRIRSLHCKDWSPEADKGYKVLFGEGVVDWKSVFAAAESVGGVEYYLLEQEGSRFSELETAERCLAEYRKRTGLSA